MLKNSRTQSHLFLALTLVIAMIGLLTPQAVANSNVNGHDPFRGPVIENNRAGGALAPGDFIWYKFVQIEPGSTFPQAMQVNLVLTPNQAEYISLDVFSSDQVRQWYSESHDKMKGFGSASVLSHKGGPNIGEISWRSEVTSDQTYYIRVLNDSDFAVDYSLSVEIDKFEEAEVKVEQFTPETVTIDAANTIAEPAAVTKLPEGIDPNHPATLFLTPREVILEKGHLAAGGDRWLAIEVAELGAQMRQPLNLTLFLTPADGNMIHKVHMDLFPGTYPVQWSGGNFIDNFGSGRIVERDGDLVVGELIWNGHLNNNEIYYIRLRNDNSFDIDYWLFTGDIINAELGDPTAAPKPALHVTAGVDPNHSLPLSTGLNRGELEPGEDRWFSLMLNNLDDDIIEAMDLSLYFTPNDGNNLHQVHLDLFDGVQRNIWSRGTLDQLQNFGVASIVNRDDNPETGELSWSGHFVEDGVYYIRLRNDSSGKIDYWLFTGQIINPDLGKLANQ